MIYSEKQKINPSEGKIYLEKDIYTTRDREKRKK